MNGNDELKPASAFRRLTADLIDFFLLVAIYTLALFFIKPLRFPDYLALYVNLCIFFGYFVGIACSKWKASPGKRLLGLLVVDDRFGRPLTNNWAVARTAMMLLPLLPTLYCYYLYYPMMLTTQYEYRMGSGALYQKMQKGKPFTPEEQKRWDAFQEHVQGPVTRAWLISLELTAGMLVGGEIFMICNRRKKAVHDMLCETIVIRALKTTGG